MLVIRRVRVCAILSATVIGIACALSAVPAAGQAFADVKTALVDYSKADLEPRKACEAMSKYKTKEIAQINASMVAHAA